MPGGERIVAHFDLDAFFVAVAVLHNSKLKGKPVIIGGGERGVVAACSYEARVFKVRSGMPMKTARYLCPHAIIIAGDYDEYCKYSRLVTDVISSSVPVVEKASIDEFYADLTGMDKFFNLPAYIAGLKQKISKEVGLPISYAVAINKLIGKVATNEVKPNGQIIVPPGTEKHYLQDLPIEKLPMVGDATATALRELEIATVGVLAKIPVDLLTARFGKNGMELSRRANGIDETPVIPFREQKSISSEETFNNDTIDIDFMQQVLVRLAETVGYELRKQNKLAGCITVKLRYSDFNTVTKQIHIPYSASDHILIDTVKNLFRKLYDRRLLIRLIGVRLSELISGHTQINLFEHTQPMINLYKAIDRINTDYGTRTIFRARGLKRQ